MWSCIEISFAVDFYYSIHFMQPVNMRYPSQIGDGHELSRKALARRLLPGPVHLFTLHGLRRLVPKGFEYPATEKVSEFDATDPAPVETGATNTHFSDAIANAFK